MRFSPVAVDVKVTVKSVGRAVKPATGAARGSVTVIVDVISLEPPGPMAVYFTV